MNKTPNTPTPTKAFRKGLREVKVGDAADARAMSKIVWQLTVNNIEKFGFRFNEGTEAQLNLEQVARFVGDKLNVWWETVVRWYRGMTYSGYNIDVCDRWGLNELYIKF